MRQFTYSSLLFFMFYFSAYAQEHEFNIKSYYLNPNEIAVEIENKSIFEMVIMTSTKSSVLFHNESNQCVFGDSIKYKLQATDSLRILARIPQCKTYRAIYQVADASWTKMNIIIGYSFYFVYPPIMTKWERHSQEYDILPYDSLRNVDDSSICIQNEALSGEPVYDNPDIMPKFPGGRDALESFLMKETYRYVRNGTDMDRVLVKVIVEKDGSITHPCVLSAVHSYWGLPTLEIIQRMPKWKPGCYKGKNVRSFCTISIIFRLF